MVSVSEYLKTLPPERRSAISKVRSVIRKNLPKGFVESIQFGMISYAVPLTRRPETYNGQPLMYAALASQKNHMAVYLVGIYTSPKLRTWFEREYVKSGKKPDIGKSCVRFKTLDALPVELIGAAVSQLTVDAFLKLVDAAKS